MTESKWLTGSRRNALLVLLGLAVVGLLIWHFGWELPRQRCEAARKWWDPGQRVCATPILTSDVTGRLIDNPQAREEALRAIGRLPPRPEAAVTAKPATK